jgi:hypothetical protein
MARKANIEQEALVAYISVNYGSDFGSSAIIAASNEFNTSYSTVAKRLDQYKVSHGRWNLTAQEIEKTYNAPAAEPISERAIEHVIIPRQSLIPNKDANFVSFGNFSDVKKIISSGIFYPVFITGMSGNGKTFGVEQACAQLKRELIRVNITIETDEDDLIGGFRLVNGETVWHNGPVIEALERGAVLLLDEIDLASNKIMCLQSILEGNGVFLKKTGRYVQPSTGFTIVATANTKGKGSDDGRFIGTNVLNEAFLERFALTFEQDYPSPKIEQKILSKLSVKFGCPDEEFCEKLSSWADIIRKTYKEGAIDEIISTRRLTHIIRAYSIFGKRMKAIQVCINRFDTETKTSFLELYDKIDASVGADADAETKTETDAEYQF